MFALPAFITLRIFSYLVFSSTCVFLLFSVFGDNVLPAITRVHTQPSPANPIHNRTLGFQHIYTIELPERTDRKKHLLSAANISEIDVIIRDGVRDADVADERPPDFPNDLREGDLACAVTHIRAWDMIAENRIATALVTEGDVDWDPRLKDQLSSFAAAAAPMTNFFPNTELFASSSLHTTSSTVSAEPGVSPYGNDWDLIWLGSCGVSGERFFPYADPTVPPHDKEHQLIRFKFGHDPFPSSARTSRQRLVTNVREGVCTQAYAISLRGAERMSAWANATDQMIDTYIGTKCGDGSLKCVAPWPQIFDDAKSTSSMDLPKGEVVGEPQGAKGDSTLEYSIRVNDEKIRLGKGVEEWLPNWG